MPNAVAGAEKTSRVDWRPSYRLVPSRFPPIQLFERVADPADLEAVIAIESLTNDRIRDEVGEIRLVAPEDRISGPGSSAIMAAFTHVNPEGGRFTDGTFGAYYAAHDLHTAACETAHHRAIFLARTKEAPGEIDMRCYQANLQADLVDIRGQRKKRPDLYDPDSYARSSLSQGRFATKGPWASCGTASAIRGENAWRRSGPASSGRRSRGRISRSCGMGRQSWATTRSGGWNRSALARRYGNDRRRVRSHPGSGQAGRLPRGGRPNAPPRREDRRLHLGGTLRKPHQSRQAPLAFRLARRKGARAVAKASEHRAMQKLGRESYFADYRLRVAEVVRDYGMKERGEVPEDSKVVNS